MELSSASLELDILTAHMEPGLSPDYIIATLHFGLRTGTCSLRLVILASPSRSG